MVLEIWAIAVVVITTNIFLLCLKKEKKHCGWNLYCLAERERKKRSICWCDFMSACLHSWWILPRRLGGTLLWTGDQLADNPAWTLLPHRNPEKRNSHEKKKTAQRAFCFDTLNNRGVVAILCKNTTCRCSNNKTAQFSVSEINTGSELISSFADRAVSWLGKLTRGTSAME